jgi:fibronectin-binding autotransporter adhesin
MSPRKLPHALPLLAAALLGSAPLLHAQNGTWTNPGTGNWGDSGNWNLGTVATGADNTATFTSTAAGNAVIRLEGPRTIGNLTFTGGSGFNYTIENIRASTNILTLARGSGVPTISVASSTTATISAVIAGTSGLQTSGGGATSATLILTGANTYTGATTITSGMVRINSNANFGAESNTLTLNHANGGIQFGGVVGNLRNIIMGASGGRLHTNGFDIHYASNLSGGGAINKLGNGTLTLAGNNSGYTGPITVSQGWLEIDSNARLGNASALILNNAAGAGTGGLRYGAAFNDLRNFDLGGSGARLDTNGFDVTYGGSIASTSAALTKDGDGTLTMTGALGYTGATVVNGGELVFNKTTGSAATTGALTLRGAGFGLVSGGAGQTFASVTVESGRGSLRAEGGAITANALTVTATGTAMNFSTASGGSITVTGAADGILGRRMTFNGQDWAAISGGQVVAFSGYTDNLATATSATGGVHYRQTGNATLAGAISVSTLKLQDNAAGQSLTIGTTLSLEGSGLLYSGTNGYSINGGTLRSGSAGGAELVIHTYGTGALTINSNILASNFVVAGTGELVLGSATGNSYTAATYINDATVSVSANNQLGVVATGSAINLNGGTLKATSTFALNNAGANHRNIILGGGGGTVNVTGANTLTVSGVVSTITSIPNNSNYSGLGSLTKTGSGVLVLSNTNTYGGRTNVREGKLLLSGSAANSAAFVSSGATLASGNNITSTIGAVTVESDALGGGTLAPGDGTVGRLIVNGNVNLGTTGTLGRATLSLHIAGTTGGTQYDQLQLTGASLLNLNNVDLAGTLLDGFTPNAATFNSGTNQYNLDGDLFFIAIGAADVNGVFANQLAVDPLLAGYNTINLGGQQFAISYNANSATNSFTGGNDVALMAMVPEPGSIVMLALAGGFLAGQRRRRARAL